MIEWGAGEQTEIVDEGPSAKFRAGASRQSIRWRSRRRFLSSGRTQVLVIALATLELCAVIAGIASPFPGGLARLKFAGPSTFVPQPVGQGGQLSAFTDYEVTMYCDNGEIYEAVKGDPVLCDNGQGGGDFPAGSYGLGAVADSGYQFSSWSATGDVKMSGSTMTVSGTGTVTATFTACSGISVSTPSSFVQYGYRQAWVNFSYTSGASQSFSWGANNATYANPTPTGGPAGTSYDLNDLAAGTTYSYTVLVSGHCAESVQKSGTFTTASSLPIIDGSNDTFQNSSTSASTNLTTSLTHDLIVAEVAVSTSSGKVTSCASAGLNWTQRASYTPSTASPWVFEWDAKSAGKLTNEKITCTYSATLNIGLIVFGVANAYLASPYDNGSSPDTAPCKAQGVPEVLCQITTTEPDDLLLGLVASYHTTGSPAITPGHGYTQIQQKDVGPYSMAEFYATGPSTGTYTISANDSGVSGMAIIGDAVRPADFIGWVSNMTSNALLLDQVGAVMPRSSVWLGAKCYYETAPGDVIGPYYRNFSAVVTDASGYFQLGVPPPPYSWTQSGPHYTAYTETQTLGVNGVCTTSDNQGDGPWTASNSKYLLGADYKGYWNATVYVSSTFSPANDYQQFGLEPNGVDVAATAVAFIHTQYAECLITTATGMSQTVSSYLAGSGFSYSSGNSTSQANEQPYGNDSSIAWHYTTSGVMNETSGAVVTNTYAVSGPYGVILGEPFTDPDSAPPNTTTPYTLTVYPGGLIDGYSWLNGGNYTSTSGLDISVGLSGGWGGESIGPGAYVDLSYTTSETASSQKEIYCSFEDPSTTEPVVFYLWADGSETSIGEAINVHIWLDEVE